MSAIVKFTKFQ